MAYIEFKLSYLTIMFVHNIELFYLIQYDTIQWNVKFMKTHHTTYN